MKRTFSSLALLAATLVSGTALAADNEVNVYSYRQPYLIEPMLKEFTKETGIKVNMVYAEKGLVERLKREGELSPADVVLTVDISRVMEVVNAGLAQPLQDAVLEKNIPAQYRDSDGRWFALTLRARAIYSSKDRVGPLPLSFTYADLADPKYKGKVCVRSGKNAYNVSLVASMIAHQGVEKTRAWLEGVKANLAQKPQGGDRDQVKAIKEGVCDLALGNSYYLGKMLEDDKQKAWAESAIINFPNQQADGTHVNISGVVLTKYAPNKDNAIKLMEFLSGDTAQHMYAEVNYEYPVKADVAPSELVASWGTFKADKLPLETIANNYNQALQMIDEVKFDL